MNILYIAYSCLPNKGSEEKIGWNIPIASAKYNRVFVLTKEEHRQRIEAYVQENGIENISFYYVDIPKVYKRMFRGIAYSGRLNIWHRRAFPVAKQICEAENIDLIHQITPIEFRSIGNYGKIPNVKFVCGPLGGGENMPKSFKKYVGKYALAEFVRGFLNTWFRFRYKIQKKLSRCDYIFFANRETEDYLSGLIHHIPHELFFDNGIDDDEFSPLIKEEKHSNHKTVFLVAGRAAYRKGHRFLLDALAQLPEDLDYECRIVGDGPELKKLKFLSQQYGIEAHVTFVGRIPYTEMTKEYENADVLIMPSIRETTGAVLLEAMSKGLPVVTINRFGGPVLIDNTTGWLYDGNSTQEYMDEMCRIIVECVGNPEEVQKRGQHAAQEAKKQLWANKMSHYQRKYEAVLGNVEVRNGRTCVNRCSGV